MTLKKIFGTPGCDQSSCPTIYQNESGSFFIQGYIVAKNNREGADIPEGEDLVEVPKEFLEAFVKQQVADKE
jgi:hypothetical protein